MNIKDLTKEECLELLPWNFDFYREPFQHQLQALIWSATQDNRFGFFLEQGLGKAQPLDAELLTPTGWKTMGEVQVGDYVINAEGNPTRVLKTYPQGKKLIYKLTFKDGAQVECCEDHLWEVYTSQRRRRGMPPLVLTVKELLQNNYKLNWKVGKYFKFYVPIVKSIKFTQQQLVIHPYILGVLLGDGSLSSNFSITSADIDIIKKCEKYLPTNHTFTKYSSDYGYGISSFPHTATNIINSEIRNLKLNVTSEKKFIPKQYLFSSIEDRIHLLQGIMDTDGTQAITNVTVFNSTSLQLIKDVQFLVRSLGGLTSKIKTKQGAYTKNGKKIICKLCYGISIYFHNGIIPFSLKRKIEKIKPKPKYNQYYRSIVNIEQTEYKECKCIQIDDPRGLYITNDVVLTHNTKVSIDYLRLNQVHDKILVVTVNFPLAHNWVSEFELNAPFLQGVVLEGTRDQRIKLLNISKNFYVINFDGIRTIFNELKNKEWNAIIIDESRRIKDIKAQRTQLCIDLGRNVPHKILLSGIPTVHPTDIFSQFLFLDEGETFGTNFFSFRNKYFKDSAKEELIKQLLGCYEDKTVASLLRIGIDYVAQWREATGIQYNPNKKKIFVPKYRLRMQKWEFKNAEKEAEFLEIVSKKSIRFVKREALDLPEKIYQRLYVHLTPQQEDDYLKLLHKDNRLSVSTLTDRQLENCFMKYSQITGGFMKVGDNDYRYYPSNPKLDLLMDIVYDGIDSTKIVIFHRFIAEGRLIERQLQKAGIPFSSMRSEIKNTTAEYNKFLQNENVRVMVAHPQSGGIGLNFTNSSICIYYSLDYNIEYKLQSEDRQHRIGQTQNVTYYHLLATNTIDDEVWKAHQEGIGLMRRVNDYQLTIEQVARGMGNQWKEKF